VCVCVCVCVCVWWVGGGGGSGGIPDGPRGAVTRGRTTDSMWAPWGGSTRILGSNSSILHDRFEKNLSTICLVALKCTMSCAWNANLDVEH
jgi:hypothetical protein